MSGTEGFPDELFMEELAVDESNELVGIESVREDVDGVAETKQRSKSAPLTTNH